MKASWGIAAAYVCAAGVGAGDTPPADLPITGVNPGDYGGDTVAVAGDGALEEFITRIMKQWHVPGLSMAILDGNKTWAKVRPPPPSFLPRPDADC